MTTSIESRISLALAAKLNKLFETEEKFLSFPLGLGFTYRYLDFMKDSSVSSLTLQEQLNYKGDFSRYMNLIPRDSQLFAPDADRFLWDEVITLLREASFAETSLTPFEDSLLSEAIDFLQDEQQDGSGGSIPVNSPALNAYYEKRGNYDAAMRNYLDGKSKIENTSGPEGDTLRGEWDTFRKQELLSALDRAKQEWENLGFKERVEYYQSIRSNLEPKKYLDLYRQAYLDEIEVSELNDINSMGVGCYVTFFSPVNAFDPLLPWQSVTMTRTEMDALVQNAPAGLRQVFNDGQGGEEIESVSLEYNNVTVMRPWFRPELFYSRYWKLPDNEVISDGNAPRKGKIPAYITSMVVARNMKVTRKKSSPETNMVFPIISKVSVQALRIDGGMVSERVKVPAVRIGGDRLSAEFRAIGMKKTLPVTARTVNGAIAFPRTSFMKRSIAPPVLKDMHADARINDRAVILQNRRKYLEAKYKGTAIKASTFDVGLGRSVGDQPKQDESLTTQTYSLEGIIVLALVCKRVPKSPDPDPGLRWG